MTNFDPAELLYMTKTIEKIRLSPYFWWWLALGKNPHYQRCCQLRGQHPLEQLYSDFGDVRYHTDTAPELAYHRWFERKTSEGLKRGEYLFGAGEQTLRLEQLSAQQLSQGTQLPQHIVVIALNPHMPRRELMQQLSSVLKRCRVQVPMPLARYSLSIKPQISRLQKQFALYDAHRSALSKRSPTPLYQLAKTAKLSRCPHPERLDPLTHKQHLTASASRNLKQISYIIDNVVYGVFPVDCQINPAK